jgi:hypothetical protein
MYFVKIFFLSYVFRDQCIKVFRESHTFVKAGASKTESLTASASLSLSPVRRCRRGLPVSSTQTTLSAACTLQTATHLPPTQTATYHSVTAARTERNLNRNVAHTSLPAGFASCNGRVDAFFGLS